MPEPENVVKILHHSPRLLQKSFDAPFNILEEDLALDWNGYVAEEDWELYPFLAYYHSSNFDLMLWHKHVPIPTMTLHPAIANFVDTFIQERSIEFVNNGYKVAQWVHWADGISDRGSLDIGVPQGQYIEINTRFLNTFLERKGLKIGYLLHQKYSWIEQFKDEVETVKKVDLLI